MHQEPEFGKIIALQGDKAIVSTLLISLSVKLQRLSKVLFVDSGNCFNPSFMQQHYQQNTRLILDNIMVARPFTAQQLHKLVKKLKDHPPEEAKVLIISSIDELFYDNEIGDMEFYYLFKVLMIELEILTQKYDWATIIGFSNKKDERTPQLRAIAMRRTSFWSKV